MTANKLLKRIYVKPRAIVKDFVLLPASKCKLEIICEIDSKNLCKTQNIDQGVDSLVEMNINGINQKFIIFKGKVLINNYEWDARFTHIDLLKYGIIGVEKLEFGIKSNVHCPVIVSIEYNNISAYNRKMLRFLFIILGILVLLIVKFILIVYNV